MAGEKIEIAGRNYSIESVRFIAAFAVICIHYFYPKDKDLCLVVNQWARFAVPFFFIVSGFFLAEKLKKGDLPIVYWKYFKKTFFLYVAWQLIYFINPPLGDIYIYGFKKAYLLKLNEVTKQTWDYIIFKAFAQHLWFFASLSLTVGYFFLFRLKRVYLMLCISIVFYIIGALTKAYARSAYGLDVGRLEFSIPLYWEKYWMGIPDKFNTNNLIFFSALPFSLGVLFSAKNIQVKLPIAILILIIGYGLHAFEIWELGQLKLKQRVDYVFSTVLMGLGVFLVAKARFKPLEWKPLASLGKYSLGIYAIHILVANWIGYSIISFTGPSFIKIYTTYSYLFLPFGTLVVSTAVTFILGKIPLLKRLV
jgi:surface polysaccharide O-acyltransferase-like enzyme